MKQLTVIGLMLSVWGMASPCPAQAIREIAARDARGESQLVRVELYRGQGVTLNFRPTGEHIRRAWLDDPSQVTLDFDDIRCRQAESETCDAQIIHLRRINPLDFPDLPTAEQTTLTVLTDDELYKFQLAFPEAGSPSYAVLEIQPADAVSTPLIAAPATIDIQRVERGLQIAQAQNLITSGDPLWQRVETFLQLMREGTSAREAARQAGISQSLVTRLDELGQQESTSAL